MGTLCWDCRNSTTKGCRWARRFRPVNGWVAVENKNGYLVEECPEFIRDSWKDGQYRKKPEKRSRKKENENE